MIFSVAAGEEGNEPGRKWKKWMRHDLLFVMAVCAVIFSCRWPFLMFPEFMQSDETAFIQCGLTLWHDPISFWRCTSAGSSGPVNIYPLLIPKLFGFPFGYAEARVVGLLLVAGAISCLYFTARKLMDRTLARLTALPVLTFFAFTVHFDFTHYSGERVPCFCCRRRC